MTKRKADDVPNGFRAAKTACYTIPTWRANIDDITSPMMTSPPPVRRQSLFEEDSVRDDRNGQPDIEMGSPMQTQPSLSAQKFWKSLCSPERQAVRKPTSKQSSWAEEQIAHPLCPPKVVPKEQFDAVQGEVSSLKQTIAWLTRELNESRSKIAQLEAQNSGGLRDAGAPLATSFQHLQQPVFFPPHQFMPVPHLNSS